MYMVVNVPKFTFTSFFLATCFSAAFEIVITFYDIPIAKTFTIIGIERFPIFVASNFAC